MRRSSSEAEALRTHVATYERQAAEAAEHLREVEQETVEETERADHAGRAVGEAQARVVALEAEVAGERDSVGIVARELSEAESVVRLLGES